MQGVPEVNFGKLAPMVIVQLADGLLTKGINVFSASECAETKSRQFSGDQQVHCIYNTIQRTPSCVEVATHVVIVNSRRC